MDRHVLSEDLEEEEEDTDEAAGTEEVDPRSLTTSTAR